jgi:hypothetical protein
MKNNRVLLSALAIATAFVSCNDKEAVGPELSAQKSVSLTIANQTSLSRAVDVETTESVAVAQASELHALFADGAGRVLEVRSFDALDPSLSEVGAGDINEDGQIYIFHQLPVAVEQVAITDYAGAVANTTTLADVKTAVSTLSAQQGALSNALVYGESTAFANLGEVHVDAGITYDLYHAGDVRVVPYVARLEILGIECTDLNGNQVNADGMLPRFGEITLGGIGIQNLYDAVGSSTLINYTGATGQADFEAALGDNAWHTDPVSAVLTAAAPKSSVVYAYQVAPGTVPNIVLKVTDGEWNTNIETPGGSLPFPFYVKSTGLIGSSGAIGNFEAGKIYQVNFAFPNDQIRGWNENTDLICIDVNVIIPEWTIMGDLSPKFD